MNKTSEKMDRRRFLKLAGSAAAATAAVACTSDPVVKQAVRTQTGDGKMTYRRNNKGEEVSILGYGCMRWPTMIDENGKEVFDQEAVNDMVDYAIEHGVTYFDTAPVYGRGLSEKVTGIALSRHPRESYTIATKLSNFKRRPEDEVTFERGVEMYHNSMKELGVDYLDYYLLHSIGGGNDPVGDFNLRFIDNGLLDYMVKEREAGRIRNLGFSFHGSKEAMDYFLSLHDEGKYIWDFVQIQMNYVDWAHTEPKAEYLYNELSRRNIPVVIMEPLLGGQLASLNDQASSLLRSAAPDKSIASWAFRFCGTHPGVMTVLSGMTYMEHVKDNVSSFSPLVPLNEEELAMLEKVAGVFANFPLVPCTACQYCMPCPYGVDIPGVFRHYNKCVNEGLVSDSEAGTPEYRKARRAFLVSLDRNLEKLRQSNHCIGCKNCVSSCPQHIRIPAEMRRIDEYTESLKRNK